MIINKKIIVIWEKHEVKLFIRYIISEWFNIPGWSKKADGTAIKVTTQENAIKNTFGKMFTIPLDFDFCKHPVCPYWLKKDLKAGVKFF